ncbi:MAG: hypothetical protein ACKVQC_05810 [Elusimicrobiota bacterium]
MNTLIQQRESLTLDRILNAGPVNRGVYLVDSQGNLNNEIMNKLIDIFEIDSTETPSRARLVAGFSNASSFHRRPSRVGQVIWIDLAKTYNPILLATKARERGLDPVRIIRAIRYCRPTNEDQLDQFLISIPKPSLWAFPDNKEFNAPTYFMRESLTGISKEAPNALWWTPLVIVSGIEKYLSQFVEIEGELIRQEDSLRRKLQVLKNRAIVVALVNQSPLMLKKRWELTAAFSTVEALAV